jgi:hypothetical protein
LPEHESVLCADGNDEGQARGQPKAGGMEEVSVSHLSKLRSAKSLDQLKILMPHKMCLCHSFLPSNC